VRLVLLGCEEALFCVGRVHFVFRNVGLCALEGRASLVCVESLALNVCSARDQAVVVQVAAWGVNEGIVIRANAKGAVRSKVVRFAVALIVDLAQTVA